MDKNELRCKRCGATFAEDEMARVSYREDYGDVSTVACPRCGSTLYDGYRLEDLFESAG